MYSSIERKLKMFISNNVFSWLTESGDDGRHHGSALVGEHVATNI